MTDQNDDLLTPREAAQLLRLAPATLAIWRCRKRYDLSYVKVGRRVMYRRADLMEFVRGNTVTMSVPVPRRKR